MACSGEYQARQNFPQRRKGAKQKHAKSECHLILCVLALRLCAFAGNRFSFLLI